MQIAILSAIIGTALFLCAYLGFRTGLRLGMNVAKGQMPPPVKTPVEVVHEIIDKKEIEKVNKDIMDELNALMNYTGDDLNK